MEKGYTHIAVVLDRSGSMAACADDTVGGFNTFVKEQQKTAGTATLTLTQFDDVYDIVHDAIDIQSVPPLIFVPRGHTALLDAIGKTIAITTERLNAYTDDRHPERVVFVILTDGHENASVEYNLEQVMGLIQEKQQKNDWQFVFLGANQDAIRSGANLGISRDSSMSYRSSREAYRTLSKTLSGVREGEKRRIGFTEDDRKENKP